jgi:hypothetical protein
LADAVGRVPLGVTESGEWIATHVRFEVEKSQSSQFSEAHKVDKVKSRTHSTAHKVTPRPGKVSSGQIQQFSNIVCSDHNAASPCDSFGSLPPPCSHRSTPMGAMA